jgi:hypothetical protein
VIGFTEYFICHVLIPNLAMLAVCQVCRLRSENSRILSQTSLFARPMHRYRVSPIFTEIIIKSSGVSRTLVATLCKLQSGSFVGPSTVSTLRRQVQAVIVKLKASGSNMARVGDRLEPVAVILGAPGPLIDWLYMVVNHIAWSQCINAYLTFVEDHVDLVNCLSMSL